MTENTIALRDSVKLSPDDVLRKIYHVYKCTGEYLGPVREYTPKGAIAWSSFWFDVPKDELCAADVWVEPKDVAKMNETRLKSKVAA